MNEELRRLIMKDVPLILIAIIYLCTSALLFSGENEFVKVIHAAGHLVAATQTSDGGYVKVSYKDDPDSLTVTKLSNTGERKWKTSFQSSVKSKDLAISSIVEVADGYLLTGIVQENKQAGLLIKLNTAGKIMWSKKISGAGFKTAHLQLQSAIAQPDGTFLTLGLTSSSTHGSYPVLTKFGPAANILWAKAFGKLAPNSNMQSSTTPDNGFLFAITRFKTFNDGWLHAYRVDLTKVNSNGDSEWAQTLRLNDFTVHTIRVTSSGNIFLMLEHGFGYHVINLNKNGQLQWTSEYFTNENMPNGYLELNDVTESGDDGYAIVGMMSPDWMCGCSDALLLKIDKQGKVFFEKKLGSHGNFSGDVNDAHLIFSTKDKGHVIFGQSYEHGVPDGLDPWNQFIIGLNPQRQASSCDSFEVTDTGFISQERISEVKISTLSLKAAATISVNTIQDLNLKTINVQEPIAAVCQ
jgi:hypothetical protein